MRRLSTTECTYLPTYLLLGCLLQCSQEPLSKVSLLLERPTGRLFLLWLFAWWTVFFIALWFWFWFRFWFLFWWWLCG